MAVPLNENLTETVDQMLPSDEKATILFVDDELHNLATLRALFRNKYNIVTATSGEQALEIFQQQKIHVIVSDQSMPGMMGHELLCQVKQISPQTMRLVLIEYSELSSLLNSINNDDVFRFINKPWQKAEIFGIVDSAVEIAKLNGQQTTQEVDETVFSQRSGAGVLIVDIDDTIYCQVGALIQPDQLLLRAKTIDKANDILCQEEIGLIIAEESVGDEGVTDFVRMLKQEYPQIMTALLTDDLDSDIAINLINQGQVYRYLRKPVSDTALNLTIKQGLQFYQRNKLKLNPKLPQDHKIEKSRLDISSFFNKLIGGFAGRSGRSQLG